MKELVDKANTAMNLILLGAGLLAWACFAAGPDPIELGVRIFEKLKSVPKNTLDSDAQKFLDEVRLVSPNETSIYRRISSIRVGSALGCRRTAIFNTDIRKSSEEEAAAWHRRITQMAQLTNVAEIRQDMDAVDMFTKSAEKDSLWGLVKELKRLVEQGGISNAATFQDLSNKLESRVKIPFWDKEVDSRFAAILLSVSLLAPLLYLMSIMAGIGLVLDKGSKLAGIDWVFFLPGRVSVSLAVLWLMSPALVLSGSVISTSGSTLLHLGLAALMGVAGGKGIIEAMQLRRRFYARLKSTSANLHASVVAAKDPQHQAGETKSIDTLTQSHHKSPISK